MFREEDEEKRRRRIRGGFATNECLRSCIPLNHPVCLFPKGLLVSFIQVTMILYVSVNPKRLDILYDMSRRRIFQSLQNPINPHGLVKQ